MRLHENLSHFVQVIENALQKAYENADESLWNKVYDFYESRYLNPDSRYRESRILYGKRNDRRP